MERYSPSRTYYTATAVALGMAAFSFWCALSWWPAYIPVVLLVASGALTLWLATRPAIEVLESGLLAQGRSIGWKSIRRVDQTNWISPMVVYLTLADGTRLRILYPGEPRRSNELLETILKNSTRAKLNGIPHAQIYGPTLDPMPPAPRVTPAPRYRLLTEEDEAEVERLYQKLKAAGRLDPDK
jgi:hypothetical protein